VKRLSMSFKTEDEVGGCRRVEEGEAETNEEEVAKVNELRDSEATSVDVEAEAWIGHGSVLFEDGELGNGSGEDDEVV